MLRARGVAWALGVSLVSMIALESVAVHHHYEPFPPLAATLASPASRLSDFIGVALGFRKLTADVAWIQTLVYYGSHEEDVDEEIAENGGGSYPLFLAYCLRVSQIDPHFMYIYYYGAGVLGWNLNRLDEAEEFLKTGIRQHPQEWRLQQYLAAMAFQRSHNINKLAEFLQEFIKQPDCPNLLRSILANIYKKQKRYRESILVWMMIFDTKDPNYQERAIQQIEEMHPLAMKMGHKAH